MLGHLCDFRPVLCAHGREYGTSLAPTQVSPLLSMKHHTLLRRWFWVRVPASPPFI
jgi:hypothetical protein